MFNKNKEVKVFTFDENNRPIRVEVINGEPWFVAKDVCQVLGISNHKDAMSRLDDDERQGVGITDPLGIKQTANAVSESGLYHLIFQSRKPEAKKFRKWVTSEVLPSIRKTGGYSLRQRRRMNRGEGVRAEMLDLLWLIGESLDHGDQRQVALELGVSRTAVSNVLNGLTRSSRILMALYRKAKENRENNMLYNEPGVMARQLRDAGISGTADYDREARWPVWQPECPQALEKGGLSHGEGELSGSLRIFPRRLRCASVHRIAPEHGALYRYRQPSPR